MFNKEEGRRGFQMHVNFVPKQAKSTEKKTTTTDMVKPLFRVNDEGSREEGAYISLEPGA